LFWSFLVASAWGAEPAAPPRYEVSINGEKFTVTAGRSTKLESQKHPGTNYQVTVRLAPLQHWRLNHVQFDYQLGVEVDDNRASEGRTATLKHPVGFVAILTDLGGAMPDEAKASAMEQLVEAMKKSLKAAGIEEVKTSKVQKRKLGNNTSEAVTFSYLSADGDVRMSAVYLVTGEGFSCSCMLQCDDENREEAVDMVKTTLGSLKRL
jgi:hypothetical protein